MLVYDEDQQEYTELDFIGHLPEDWTKPKHWFGEQVTCLGATGDVVKGVVSGMVYAEDEETWEYTVAVAPKSRYHERMVIFYLEHELDAEMEAYMLDRLFKS